MMLIRYRNADIDDVDDLAKLRHKYSHAPIEQDAAHFKPDFDRSQNDDRHQLLVASLDDKIVGYARCGLFDPNEGQCLCGLSTEIPRGYYLNGVLIDDSLRGLGIGKHLTLLRTNWVRERAEQIYCVLQSQNMPSIKMHEDLGFRIVMDGLCYQKIQGDHSGLLLEIHFAKSLEHQTSAQI